MATIKDVAKLAEVSIGTVSNVLNGKTKNEELIARVERAVETLGYRPDVNAQSLKKSKSNLVGVILPDMVNQSYADFLSVLEEKMRENGCDILVKFSHNNKILETKAFNQFINRNVDGIMVYSYLNNSNLKSGVENIPMVGIGGSLLPDTIESQVHVDYSTAIGDAFIAMNKEGITKIGMIVSPNLLADTNILNIFQKYQKNSELVETSDNSSEQGFQTFYEMACVHPDIQGIIAGSYATALGVKKAQKLLGIENLSIIVMKESCWMEDDGVFEGQITVNQRKIANIASAFLNEAISNPILSNHEKRQISIEAKFEHFHSVTEGIEPSKKTLRFAMYDCPTARSLKLLTRLYEKTSGSRIELELYRYEELEHKLYEQSEEHNSHYDGFMMDIPWLDGLIESKYVKNLDYLQNKNPHFFEGFLKNSMRTYGMYVDSYYGIPFVSGSQLLFYQKDLFEDTKLKILFQRMYDMELEPPKTWAQFNIIAEFFTRRFNEKSPVSYGASLVRGENAYTSIYFLSHLWAYASSVFDKNGNVCVNNINSLAAFKNFTRSYHYTSGDNIDSWSKASEEFKNGKSAMIILYDSDAGNLNNYTQSKIAGNLGYALIPGGKPVLGGWSLALNHYGVNQEEAEKFLTWACAKQTCIPISLLGGSSLRQEVFEKSDLNSMAPWKSMVLKSFQQSRKRIMPEILDESKYKNQIYTRIIPHEIEKVLNGEITEEAALCNMEEKITKFMRDGVDF